MREPTPISGGEKSAQPLFVLHEHANPVLCCGFYPSGHYQREESNLFLSGDVDGTVILWNLMTRRPLVSFSVLEEAHRQLRDSAQQSKSIVKEEHRTDNTSAELDASFDLRFASLGPHSRSVISVGFIPTTVALEVLRKGAVSTRKMKDLQSSPAPRQQPEKTAEGNSTISSSAVALYMPKASLVMPQRQRFRLNRHTSFRTSATTVFSPVTATTPEQAPPPQPTMLPPRICFYTHCRDQRVYIWSFSLHSISSTNTASTPQLMVILTAPQHGFCPVESVSTADDRSSRTYMVVPHDSKGEITVWEMVWRQTHESASHNGEEDRASKSVASADAGGTAVTVSNEVDSDSAEDVDTTGMNPMDALISRAVAQERREQKQREKPRTSALSGPTTTGNEGHQDQHTGGRLRPLPGAVVANTERVSFLCFVAPFATAASGNFSIRRLCSFSACPHFKGGTIMRLTMCADTRHLAVAFESGHIVLARFRASSEKSQAAGAAEDVLQDQAFECGQSMPSSFGVRCAVRAFAESALACWWSGHRVLACSAEGGLQCYEVTPAAHDAVSDVSPCVIGGALRLELLWNATLRKGIGSVCIQANLVIAGCWDSTLRLYDARDGRLVSILSYQREAINEVRMMPSSAARVAAFGFDARQPRCYAPPPPPVDLTLTHAKNANGDASATVDGGQSGTGPITSLSSADYDENALMPCQDNGEEELVYLFGSASKDGTVAVWRIDMHLIAEQAALRIMSA